MYGYDKYVPLSREEILLRVSEKEIFGIVIQEDILENKEALYKAPYRNDTIGQCYFEKFGGSLLFIDFASSYRIKSMDCFLLVAETYKVNYFQALQIINDRLNLGLGDNIEKVREVVHKDNYVEEKSTKKVVKERVITILPRIFNHKDRHFWSKYEITKQNLIDDGVIAIELYKSTNKEGKSFCIRPMDICYAYTEFSNDKKKIYRPNSIDTAGKWFTNCNQNDIGGILHIDLEATKLVITKSYKDYRVLKNQSLNVIWFQNEGMIPSSKILKKLTKKYKEIIIWFDNDNAGITNGRVVVDYLKSLSTINVRSVILPPKFLKEGIKDPSDYIANKGREALLDFIKKNKLKD